MIIFKNSILTLLLTLGMTFYSTASIAQQTIEKSSYYYGSHGQSITHEEFAQKAMSFGYDYKIKEVDTAFIGNLILKREKGSLTSKQLKDVRTYIKKLTGKAVHTQCTIVINYFVAPKDGDKTCADIYVNDSDYARRLQQIELTEQFFIAEKKYQLNHPNVYQESADFLKMFLFNNARTCGNYMILRPDGSFYSKYGEYEQDKIISLIDVNW